MNVEQELKRIDEWFKSDNGKESVKQFINELNKEEIIAKKIEEGSNLVYKDGQKVMRGDVFIDERFEKDVNPYGKTLYVYRINDDDTLDLCLSSNFAWKMNNSYFKPETSRLIRRDGKLQNPLFNPVVDIE